MGQEIAKLQVYTTSKPVITPSLSLNPHRNLSILPQNTLSGGSKNSAPSRSVDEKILHVPAQKKSATFKNAVWIYPDGRAADKSIQMKTQYTRFLTIVKMSSFSVWRNTDFFINADGQ